MGCKADQGGGGGVSALDLKPGDRFKLFFNKGNPNNFTLEIRAIVDEKQIVYMVARRYRLDSTHLFEMYEKNGYLTRLPSATP